MAKVAFTKLTPIKELENKVITIGDQEITVMQYLPVNDKLALVERVLNLTIDDTNYLNPVRLEIFTNIEIIKTYTNISITEKMMENPAKIYDLLLLNGILDKVIEVIPEEEYDDIFNAVTECAVHVINYLNSFAGMIKTISENYDATKLNVEDMMKTLDQPDKVGLLKDILDKIG